MNRSDRTSDSDERELSRLLQVLNDVSPRDPRAQAQGRAQFLSRAEQIAQAGVAVSPRAPLRHKEWNIQIPWRKEPIRMNVLATLILMVSLLFGGAGVTVAAAQGSAPDQPLYEIKLASEDARLQLTAREQTRLDLAMAFAERRIEEIDGLIRAGKTIPEWLVARWEQQVEFALRQAAEAGDESMTMELARLRERLQSQLQRVEQWALAAPAPEEAQLLRVQSRLQTRLRLVEEGIADPAGYRARVRAGRYDDQPNPTPGNPWTEETPTPGSGYGPGPGACPECTPQGKGSEKPAGSGNPWTTGTPTPGSGYGEGNQAGGNPWVEDTPTPGSGYGPGPGSGDCTMCTPQGPGPQPTNPPLGGGNGNGGRKP